VPWWQNAVIYQIYPRSYQDSDGDGTGDLKGIESRLDYLQGLGITAIWLSPIYKSPMKDFGYDISDFKDIDPIFGTLEDFTDLLTSCKERNIKLIMDFVPNHSSDEHEWFLKSLLKEEPYTDYYVWEDPKGYDDNGIPIPPSNWVSVFRFSAWEWRDERQQFYLHQFVPGQPDLNYRNPAVLKEMKDVLKFWLDLGIDGYRMDAVAHIFEDDRWMDEPRIEGCNDPDDYNCYDHIYSYNLPETKEILHEMYGHIKTVGGEDKINMVEFYGPSEDSAEYYYCSDFPFDFELLGFSELPPSAKETQNKINSWLNNLKENKYPNWVLGNHDNHRVGSKYGDPFMDIFNMLTLSLPGTTITYQGEEIGMVDNLNITFEQAVDPAGCNCGPERYLECGRDPERAPMQWSPDAPNAGFSTADICWLPVNSNYHNGINVDEEMSNVDSHATLYQRMLEIKMDDMNRETFSPENVTTLVKPPNVLVVIRSDVNYYYPHDMHCFFDVISTLNFGEDPVIVDLSKDIIERLTDQGTVLASSAGMSEGSPHPDMSQINIDAIDLRGYEGLQFLIPRSCR